MYCGSKHTSARDKHQFIDGVKSADSELPDWLLTKDVWDTEDDDSRPAEPYTRGSDAPVLLIIYFLHPRVKCKIEDPYTHDDPLAGQVPIVGLACCFPDNPLRKTRFIANKTVPTRQYVYPRLTPMVVRKNGQKQQKTTLMLCMSISSRHERFNR